MKAAITFKRLGIQRQHTTILTGISASVPAGRVTGLLGPSGSGKTTLMRAIVGLQKITAGSIQVLDQPAGTATLRHEIGYVTQAPSVYSNLTVGENLRYFATMVGASRTNLQQVIRDVHIDHLVHHLTASLSGGELARVSLAAALLGQPRLLVLDEPTVGLDPLLREQLWDHFHELAAGGTSLLVSSHVMDEAERCGNLLLLREGKLLAAGTPAELRAETGSQDMNDAFLRLIDQGETP